MNYAIAHYGSFLDSGDRTGRDWLEEFRGDLHSLIAALDDWKQSAVELLYEAMDHNAGFPQRFSVPLHFQVLTDIIALWCDSQLHIDPTPLTEVRRRFNAFAEHSAAGPHGELIKVRVSMTDEEMEGMMHKAMDVFNRVFHASLARFPDQEQRDAIQKREQGEWAADTPPPVDSPFRFGSIEGPLVELAYRIDRDQQYIRDRHGKKFWVQREHGRLYKIWFATLAELQRAEQKQPPGRKELKRTETNRTEKTSRKRSNKRPNSP